MNDYDFDSSGFVFTEALRDVEAEQRAELLIRGKLAAAGFWPYLAEAASETDFGHRLALVEDRLAQLVPPAVLEPVQASLAADWKLLHTARLEEHRTAAQERGERIREHTARARSEQLQPDQEFYDQQAGRWVTVAQRVPGPVGMPDLMDAYRSRTADLANPEEYVPGVGWQVSAANSASGYTLPARYKLPEDLRGNQHAVEGYRDARYHAANDYDWRLADGDSFTLQHQDYQQGYNRAHDDLKTRASMHHHADDPWATTLGRQHQPLTGHTNAGESPHEWHPNEHYNMGLRHGEMGYSGGGHPLAESGSANHQRYLEGMTDGQRNRAQGHPLQFETVRHAYLDPSDAQRYSAYPDLNPPVDNGPLQGPDGFVTDPQPDNTGASNAVIQQRQLTPGQWMVTPGTEWPVRPNAGDPTQIPRTASYYDRMKPTHYHHADGEQAYDLGYQHGHAGKKPVYTGHGDYLVGHRDGQSDRQVEDAMGYPTSHSMASRRQAGEGIVPNTGDPTQTPRTAVNHLGRHDDLEHAYYSGHSVGQQARAQNLPYGMVPPNGERGSSTHARAWRTGYDHGHSGDLSGPGPEGLQEDSGGWLDRRQGAAAWAGQGEERNFASVGASLGIRPLQGESIEQYGMRVRAMLVRQAGEGIEPTPGPNPNYFSQGSDGLAGPPSFPENPSGQIEPKTDNRMDDLYGAVSPQVSPGSAAGTADGQGYSRQAPGSSATAGRHPFFDSPALADRTAGFDDSHVTHYVGWARSQGKNPDDVETLKTYEKQPGIGRSHTNFLADQLYIGGGDRDWRRQAATDGRIVGHCDHCRNPVRYHTNENGIDELRHLHNNDNRCSNGQQATAKLNRVHAFYDPADPSIRVVAEDISRTRPTLDNPSGAGDEFTANTWGNALNQRPMQSAEDRHINTPTQPREPIQTIDSSPRGNDLDENRNQNPMARETSLHEIMEMS